MPLSDSRSAGSGIPVLTDSPRNIRCIFNIRILSSHQRKLHGLVGAAPYEIVAWRVEGFLAELNRTILFVRAAPGFREFSLIFRICLPCFWIFNSFRCLSANRFCALRDNDALLRQCRRFLMPLEPTQFFLGRECQNFDDRRATCSFPFDCDGVIIDTGGSTLISGKCRTSRTS
jgi:hypothetical protein